MDPDIWGPSGWTILHRLSFLFENISDAQTFYSTLQYILPCPTCKYNYKSHMTFIKFPNKIDEIPKWIYKIHNKVNKKLGKKKGPSFKKVVEKYNQVFDNMEIKCNETKFLCSLLYTFSNKKEYLDYLNKFLFYWCGMSNIKYVNIKNKKEFKTFLFNLG